MDDLINKIESGDDSFDKAQLLQFIKESLLQIKKINDAYRKFFEGGEGGTSQIALIEEKLSSITQSYLKLFPSGVADTSVVDVLQSKIDEIRQYHKVLLEGTDSVKAAVEHSQEKITNFYVELLGEDGLGGKAKVIKDFYTTLSGTEGTQAEIERISTEIIDKHAELFTAVEEEDSLIASLEKNIKKIEIFKNKVDKEIVPEIEQTRKYLGDVKIDIDTKLADVGALLSDATAKTLAEGYMESKCEYSKLKPKKYEKGKILKNISIFFFNNTIRQLGTLLDYAMFIIPLVFVSLIFINEKTAEIVLKSLATAGTSPTAAELIYVKTIISIPLIWIAWYGQRNISQRKRLFEEYNHKLRAVQMYLLFNTSDKTYFLSNPNKDKLAEILLSAIEYNPAQFLGRGETIIDRVYERFHVEGFYKKLKGEVVSLVNDSIDVAKK